MPLTFEHRHEGWYYVDGKEVCSEHDKPVWGDTRAVFVSSVQRLAPVLFRRACFSSS